ncbi:MCE family protein [Nocardia fluminea]|uniref:Virulence factor Mce-like protein n=1 Tax=Nocardia fluminea TaxID=134984 RepID=A0A2N3WX27_9NOCA|nr:MCE family protein [Nocardia fluminea]PKV98404.1 virulence factor Mce-like protein [Nocardia fluminea]
MILDLSGRGPKPLQLTLAGLAVITAFAVALYLLALRYNGEFEDTVVVGADLTSTGDGLPQRADVKYRGMLVGSVGSVEMVAKGERQHATLELKPGLAQTIPNTVTVRVIPDNIFGVSSLQLVDNEGTAEGLREGETIREDTSEATIQLQTTLNTLRDVLDTIQPEKLGRVLATLSAALDPSSRVPGSTVERLDTWLTTIHNIPEIGDLLGNFGQAATALSQSAPELVGVLADSVTTARTLNEHRTQMVELLTQGNSTIESVNALFAANPDSGKELVSGLDQLLGGIAKDPSALQSTAANLNNSLRKLQQTFNFGPSKQMTWRMDVTFTPFQQYTAKDCPHYGEMAGPRCGGPTVPEVAPPQEYPAQMLPKRLESAGPAPVAPIPGLPALPSITVPTVPGLPTFPGLPAIPGLPTIPGITAPAASLDPAPAATPAAQPRLGGIAAISQLVGGRPTFSQLLLLGSILGNIAIVPDIEGGVQQ